MMKESGVILRKEKEKKQINIDYIYKWMMMTKFIFILDLFLFGLSELMPFIKAIKSNGFCDAVWCAICNSKCLEGIDLEGEEYEDAEEEVQV